MANDSDPEDDGFTITSVTSVQGDVTGPANGEYTFIPNQDYTGGAVDLSYTIEDDAGATDDATATFAVTPYEAPNEDPEANDDTFPGSVEAGQPIVISASDLLDNDTDSDGDALTITDITPTAGQGELVPSGDQQWTFIPAIDFSGEASFTYTVSDGQGGTDTATATVSVTPYVEPNQAPVAADDTGYSVTNNDTLMISVSDLLSNDTDVDGDTLMITGVSDPVGGTVELVSSFVSSVPTIVGTDDTSNSHGIISGNGRYLLVDGHGYG
jgi:hypothetical protein